MRYILQVWRLIMASKTIAFDFDGVIHNYTKGWYDGSIYDTYNTDVIECMCNLMQLGYSVAIVSTRHPIQISEWWNKHDFPVKADPVINDTPFWNNTKYVGIFNRKIPAMVYVDDRAFKFNPDKVDDLFDNIINFKTWQDEQRVQDTESYNITLDKAIEMCQEIVNRNKTLLKYNDLIACIDSNDIRAIHKLLEQIKEVK